MNRRTVVVVAALMVSVGSHGGARIQEAPIPDGAALLTRIDRTLNPPAYEAYKRIINVEPSGRQREYLLFTLNSGQDKVAALFLSPAADKGRSTLRVGENMWLYIPNAGKPVRITSLQSVVGGVFNNADILRVDYATEYDVVGLEDTSTEYVLRLKAKSRSVAYDRLVMRVTRATMLPVQIDCRTEAGMLVKSLHFKDVKDFGGNIVRPATVETDSPLFKGYKSSMVFVQMKARTVPAEVFTLTYMPNLDAIRQ